MQTRAVFAYGTLRDPDVLSLVLGRRPLSSQFCAAIAPGHAVVPFPGRTYPAIRVEPNAEAPGTLLEGLTVADISALDRFEGPEYSRGPIEIIAKGQVRIADVYWPGAVVGPAPAWRLEDWVRRFKPAFLAGEASDITALRQHLTDLGST